ncbi:MAG: AsmA-like C-terminal domain-containing protein [Candidatus Schekmanbacteria bacterium]|nr:AsmA-like C-terminal domain-containing protein [Candidatus Schekmanbacteria bacterium]
MLKKYLAIILIALILLLSAYLLLISKFDPNQLVSDIITKAAVKNGLRICYGSIHLSIWNGPAARVDNVLIQDITSGVNILSAEKIYVVIKLFPLIFGEVRPDAIIIHSSNCNIMRDKNGEWLIPRFLKEKKENEDGLTAVELIDAISSFQIQDGNIQFTDSLQIPQKTVVVRDVQVSLKHSFLSKMTKFSINASVTPEGGEQASIAISGKSKLHGIKDFKSLIIDSHINVTALNPADFKPYMAGFTGFENIKGKFELDLDIKTLPISEGLTVAGEVSCDGLTYVYPKLFLNPVISKKTDIEFAMEYRPGFLDFKSYSANFDLFRVDGSFSVKRIDDMKNELIMSFSSPGFPYNAAGKNFVPFEIFSPKLREFMLEKIDGGEVNLRELLIKVNIIKDKNKKNEHGRDLITMDASFNNVAMNLGHSFKQIDVKSGSITIKDGDIKFTDSRGTYGDAKVKLTDGYIKDIYGESKLHIDTSGEAPYSEIRDFLTTELLPDSVRKYASKVASPSGTSSINLLIEHNLSKSEEPISFSGNAKVSAGSFVYEGIKGRVTVTSGSSRFSNALTELENINLDALDSHLTVSGTVRKAHPESPPVSEINVRGILSDSILKSTILKEAGDELNVHGNCRFRSNFTGTADNIGFDVKTDITQLSIDYGTSFTKKLLSPGNFMLTGNYSDSKGFVFEKSVLNMEGNKYEIKGEYNKANKPSLILGISGNYLNLENVSLNLLPLKPLQLSGKADTSINLSYDNKDNFTADIDIRLYNISSRVGLVSLFDSISGRIVNEVSHTKLQDFKVKTLDELYKIDGEIVKDSDEKEKKVALFIKAKTFDLDKFIKSYPEQKGIGEKQEMSYAFGGRFESRKMVFLDNTYENLSLDFALQKNILTLADVKASSFKGNATASGSINFADEGKTRFDICSEGKKINIKKILEYLGVKGSDFSGDIDITDCISSSWKNAQEIRANLEGKISFISKNGTIKKTGIGVISKILSFFNVFSWKDFWIKDIETKGMTYNTISADFTGKEGIFHTENFLLDGSSMKISAIGDIDLKNYKINMTVGVMPLGTVDTIISKIPIVGYILTGKDKSLISAYFEVTGDLKNPEVKPVNIKSMGSGILGLLRRSLGFPYDLIKDMGSDKKTEPTNEQTVTPLPKQ